MKLGLVLSGGGAKGMFHLGALQYLSEEGIEFDVISGTSAGSMASVLLSLGLKPSEIKDDLLSVQFKSLTSVWSVWGKAGLINPHSMKEVLNKTVLKMENLEQDFIKTEKEIYITATDMEAGNSVVFSREQTPNIPIIDAMMASSAYPFMFSPMEIKGVKYSDGGILCNFPVEVIKHKVDYLFGIYLSPISSISSEELNSSKNVLFRALSLIGKDEEIKLKDCNDVLYVKELSKYATFEFDKKIMQEIYDLGYESMKNEKTMIKRMKQLMRYKKAL